MFFPCVRECLDILQQGNATNPPEDVIGTRVYLLIGWTFVEIFCSFEASLYQRVVYASKVNNFLRIWRWWIYQSDTYNITDNFLTKQCFEDVVLSCHAAVLLIKATQDFTPEQEVCLSKCGSDVCEDFFSQNGSWVMNKHTYTFGDMLTNLPAMNRILQIRGNAAGPDVPKGHKKQCNIWKKGKHQTTPASKDEGLPH
jgi:hypothetical protein